MTRMRITRLANPHRKRRKAVKVNRRRKNSAKRRKMSAKQIRIFGTKRQKAALKAARKRKVTRRAKAKRVNPTRRRRARRPNPVPVLVTMGAVNPRRRRKKTTMAKTKRRKRNTRHVAVNRRRRRRVANPVARRRRRRAVNTHRRRRRNPVVIVTRKNRRRRRVNSHRRRRHVTRRNPVTLFGQSITSKGGLKLIGGGVLGVVGAKFLPTLLPASLISSFATTNLGKTAITAAAAIAEGFLVSKWDRELGAGVLFGGLMQTVTVGLNAFVPNFYKQISGYATLGDLTPAGFPVPQNPLRLPPAPSNQMAVAGQQVVSAGALGRAYPGAY